ncbi:hypothetical protein psul1_p54 [Paracoccus phage vB_PsuS_Psul1]|nr:hypothetical protein psul1_p54 [Paracoccus phage vB_PsuS_Psul1]
MFDSKGDLAGLSSGFVQVKNEESHGTVSRICGNVTLGSTEAQGNLIGGLTAGPLLTP